jgi:hypothetical protein
MPKKVEVEQAEIEVNGRKYYVTHIPTATSGMWFTIHDLFEVWAAVAIDLDGTLVGWRNEPDEPWATQFVEAIRKEFDLKSPVF